MNTKPEDILLVREFKKLLFKDQSFVLLCVNLCAPLWFKEIFFTTKDSKDFTKIRKGLFRQLQFLKILKWLHK
jgi:hypothetical protein